MYHFYDVVINDKTGVPIPGVIIRVTDIVGTTIPIYADNGGTPIEVVSGIADAAVTDNSGNFDFYVEEGVYNLSFYIGDALLKVLQNIWCGAGSGGAGSPSILHEDVATEGQVDFVMPFPPAAKPIVYRNTGRLPMEEYTWSGTLVTLLEGCHADDPMTFVLYDGELNLATDTSPGLLSPMDKQQLDNLASNLAGKAPNVLATTSTAGQMSAADKAKIDGVVYFWSGWGAVYDGVTNMSANLQAACDALRGARGGKIYLGHYGKLLLDDGLFLPPNIQLIGEFDPQKPRTQWNYLDTCPTVLIIPSDKSIVMDGSSISNCLLWMKDIEQDPQTEAQARANIANFAGTAITASGDDPHVYNCMAIGFDLMAQFTNVFRPVAMGNIFDCNGGIDVSAAYDFGPYGISDNLGQAVYIQYRPWPIDITRRPGTAIYVHDVADGVKVFNNKSFGYQTGLHLRNVFEVEASHIADGPALSAPAESVGTTGIWLDGILSGCKISGGAHGQEIGWKVEATGTYDIVSGSCGFALQNQVYIGPDAMCHIGNMKLSGHTTYPIYVSGENGVCHGTVDSFSTANSGDLIFMDDLDGKNRLVDLVRRQYSTPLDDPFPEIYPEVVYSQLAGLNAKQGKEVFVTDSTVTTPGTNITTGGGVNKVKAQLVNSNWKVM